MPQESDNAYNQRVQAAFEEELRSGDGGLAQLLQSLRELTVRAVEVLAQGDGYEDTEQRLEAATEELQGKAAQAVAARVKSAGIDPNEDAIREEIRRKRDRDRGWAHSLWHVFGALAATWAIVAVACV